MESTALEGGSRSLDEPLVLGRASSSQGDPEEEDGSAAASVGDLVADTSSSVEEDGFGVPLVPNSDGESAARRKRRKRKLKFALRASNPLSQLCLWWVGRLVWLLQSLDVRLLHLSLDKSEQSRVCGGTLQATWDSECRRAALKPGVRPSLLKALFHAFGYSYFPLALYKIVWVFLTWFGVYYCMDKLIVFKESGATDKTVAHYYAMGLFACILVGSLCFHQLTMQTTRIGIQCRAALMVLIYRKSLRLSYVKGGVGDIVNLISNECNKIAEACVHWHSFWSAGLHCVALIVLCWLDVGVPTALAPLGFIILLVLPVQYTLARWTSNMSGRVTHLITKRVHLMSEVLTAIKLIKFYAWESFYRLKVNKMRELEIDGMRRELGLKIASYTIVFTAPVVSTFISLVTYRTLGNKLTSSVVFLLLYFFNTLRHPLMMLPTAERTIDGAMSAFKRLEEFFLLPEMDPPTGVATNLEPGVCMRIEDADFVWDGDLDHPHIYNLTLSLRRGELIAVVGDIGSGKSLLAAIMGQIKRTRGLVESNNAVCGFIPQEPWLINASLRDNILFGIESEDEATISAAYSDAIRISGLTRDFLLLSNGDDTFVNELNLSASQKQRISLARCIIHNPDIVLMEDCLNDFDQNNARRIFKECIRNTLSKDRCVVMLTSQMQLLPECDRILVLKGGRIMDEGTMKDLKARHPNLASWVTDVVNIEDDPLEILEKVNEIWLDPVTRVTERSKVFLCYASPVFDNSQQISPLRPKNPNGPLSHLPMRKATKPRSSPLASANVINAANGIELLVEQNIKSIQNSELNEHTISKMIERSQGGVLRGNTMRPPANFANQDVVTRTIEANQLTVHSVHTFDVLTVEPGVFDQDASTHPLYSLLQFLKEGTSIFVGVFIIVAFFFATAIRILSDVWLVFLLNGPDDRLTFNLAIYGVFCAVLAGSVLFRSFGFAHVILSKSMSWHKRLLEAALLAPMSFFDSTPLGHILSFFARHLFLVDEILPETALQVLSFTPLIIGTMLLVAVVVPWFALTLPVYLLLVFICVKKCFYVQQKFQQLESNNKSPMFAHLSATLEGLFSIRLYKVQDRFDVFNRTLIDADHKALYSMLLVKTFMSLCLDCISSVFIYIMALFLVLFDVDAASTGLALTSGIQLLLFVPWFFKLIFELKYSMESVSALIYFSDHVRKEDEKVTEPTLPPDWPPKGEIEFKNVTLRYHRYGVAVLKNVSFHIRPKEKIAIVGRSGSGKTTLLMALMRITELAEGVILIDGVDTGSLSLTKLRSRIAVIPQEPIMLTGTIRSNLDPFELNTDEELWAAMKAVHLDKKIQELPAKLETYITENGRIFNILERQLFCIARAILIKTKIVVFDEPALAVDQETEHVVQTVMQENFQDATVVLLATRFNAIVQCDRVIVMNHGKVVEFDTPLGLLNDPKSKFSLMLAQSGDVDSMRLRQMAQSRSKVKAAAAASSNTHLEVPNPSSPARMARCTAFTSGRSDASASHSLKELFGESGVAGRTK